MKILAIGAHYDDIEINCAGSLLKAKELGHEVSLVVCTDGSLGGNPESRRNEQEVVNGIMGYNRVFYLDNKDGFLLHDAKLVRKIDDIIKEVEPDYIVTHNINDTHQDHVAVARSVRSANRNVTSCLVTFPGNDVKRPFSANLFVDITDYFQKKVEVLDSYESQASRPWLSYDMLVARNIGTGISKFVERFKIDFFQL